MRKNKNKNKMLCDSEVSDPVMSMLQAENLSENYQGSPFSFNSIHEFKCKNKQKFHLFQSFQY
jgi:hypothetical protein